jgi:hypothetical protein
VKGGKEKEIDIFHGTHMLHFFEYGCGVLRPGKNVLIFENTCVIVRIHNLDFQLIILRLALQYGRANIL